MIKTDINNELIGQILKLFSPDTYIFFAPILSFRFRFNKHLLSIYHVLGSMLGIS